jgi:hypothetical protein
VPLSESSPGLLLLLLLRDFFRFPMTIPIAIPRPITIIPPTLTPTNVAGVNEPKTIELSSSGSPFVST